MIILKSIGTGEECVYVYYYPNDKLLSEVMGRDTWECKIGMTSTGDALSRVIAQTSKTSRHQEPTVALEIRTNNAYALESEIHRAFYADRISGDELSGCEWFMINPEKVEDYFTCRENKYPTTIHIDNAYIIDDLSSISKVIRQIRKKMKLRQEDFELSRQTILRVEQDGYPIQTDSLLKIVEKLNCRLVIVPVNKLQFN